MRRLIQSSGSVAAYILSGPGAALEAGAFERDTVHQAALAVNLVLNGSWSWLFFNRHYLATSAAVAGALAVSSADLTRRAVAVRGVGAAPLALYPLWCSFATVLSTHIWLLNRRRRRA